MFFFKDGVRVRHNSVLTQALFLHKIWGGGKALLRERVAAHDNGTRNQAATLLAVGVVKHRPALPRVARSSQPWALLRNPFGILPKNVCRVDALCAPFRDG